MGEGTEAGLSLFTGLPMLRIARSQKDLRALLFFCQIHLFLSKMNLEELTENCKLPEGGSRDASA